MKNFTRFLCLALCLCLLPVFGLATSADAMTAYEAAGVTYYIWNSWPAPEVQDDYTYYYKTAGNPMNGFVMIMELDSNDTMIPTTENDIKTALSATVTGLSSSLGSEVSSEDLVIDGRQGIYFYGVMADLFGLAGYVTVNGTATGTFTGSINNLIPGTTYYVNAFATNAVGTIYSADVTFTTTATPVVTTNSVHNITCSSAIGGGTVVYDGGVQITDRGVCWSTQPEPTLDDYSFSEGFGTGDFTCVLSELENNTIYYVRAYATNNLATVYGESVSFSTLDSTFTCGVSTIRDYDGNLYHTVAIGTQCWTKENMRSTHFPDGTQIPLSATASATTAARCYPNGNADNVGEYGYLYTWSAGMHGNPPTDEQGICPDGWHIPDNGDWQKLFGYVGSIPLYACGGSSGNYSKALAADYAWLSASGSCVIGSGISNNNATDFTMLPAGENDGSYSDFRSMAGFHSSSHDYETSCKIFYFYRDDPNAFSPICTMINRMESLRCLRDIPLNKMDIVVVTKAADSITTTSAVIPYTVGIYGNVSLFSSGVCWSTEPAPSLSDNTLYGPSVVAGDLSLQLTDLESNTVYYVRAFATNDDGTVYGRQRMFHTLDSLNAGSANPTPILPIVKTLNVANGFNGTYAYCDGNVQFDGYSTVTERGICWGLDSEPTISGLHMSSGSGTGAFTAKANGLTPGITYYLRAYATNSAGTAYGEDITFTVPSLPGVTTAPISQNSGISAVSGGTIDYDGDDIILACGICWDTTPSPSLAGMHTVEHPNSNTFVSMMEELTPATTYYVRAYVTNRVGTTYGLEVTFTTLAIPEISTEVPNMITYNSAWTGGSNIQDNGFTITEKGICWSEQPHPDINGQHGVADGAGTFPFAYQLTGLTQGLRYYVRAYATNSQGTAYGQEVTFTARNDANPCPYDTTVTDFEGNIYHTVQIGQQCWLRENLRSTHYTDGSYFTGYHYPNNDIANVPTYGLMYKWPIIMHGATATAVPGAVQGICPNGWHIPSYSELQTLRSYIETTYTCSARAVSSTSGWHYFSLTGCYPGYNQQLNNESGFSAYPTGSCYNHPDFSQFGYSTSFWSTTNGQQYATSSVYCLVIEYGTDYIMEMLSSQNKNLPVRCVKND